MESKRALSRPLHGPSKKPRLEQYPLANSSTAHSSYGVPTSLKLGRKIFLSHSGKDKDFVRFLHKELCSCYHDAVTFFDAETLPKAEAVSMENILEEARRSELGVLVLTEDFFTHTQNPMLELDAFVAGEVKLLPLFLTMSVNQFKEKERRDGWEKQWREWSAVDDKVIKKWRDALDLVITFCGLEYCKIATNLSDYIDKIVKEVTRIIRPAISFSKEGVCGKDRLCKIVNYMYEECASKRRSSIDCTSTHVASTSASSGLGEYSGYTLDVVGIYGFTGLGKTTLCKCLCDFYFAEFNGKVCYIDLGSLPSHQPSSQKHFFSIRMQHLLSMLTGCNNNLHYFQDIDQVQNLLRKQFSSMKDPLFLAIDNILPEWESQIEAAFYLSCEFPKGSKIFITSKSESILENLTNQHSNFSVVIEYMPALELNEARGIFINEISTLSNDGILNEEDKVNECVNMCTIQSQWYRVRYHPLMLKSLAASIRWDRMRNRDWKGTLAKLRMVGNVEKSDAQKMVFGMLDINYTLLSEEAKKVVLDLALFCSATRNHYAMCEWIERVYSHLHKKNLDEIFLQLQDLCFIEGKSEPLLDLLVDFCKYKASQAGVNSHYVVVEDGAHCPDELPRSARHVSISRCEYEMQAWTLDLRNVEGVKVLHLVDNAGLQEVLLSRTTCAHLRSLIVRVPAGTSLCCTLDEDWSSTSAACQLKHDGGWPCMCLQWVELEGNVCFTSLRHLEKRSWLPISHSLRELEITSAPVAMDLGSILGDLRNLESLSLFGLDSVRSIDVTPWPNLKNLELTYMPSLKFICGLNNSPHLQDGSITSCDVSALTIPADSKTYFQIWNCTSLERISLCTVSSYPAGGNSSTGPRYEFGRLQISGCPTVTNVDGLSQYTGSFDFDQAAYSRQRLWTETFGDLLKDAGIDSSICKGRVRRLKLTGYNPAGLAGAKEIHLMDVQHIGLLISALFKAEPEHLKYLSICCKEGGDCGCDQNVPHFGPLPRPSDEDEDEDDDEDEGEHGPEIPLFRYCCPQMR